VLKEASQLFVVLLHSCECCDISAGKQLPILLRRRVRFCRGQLQLLLITMAVRLPMVNPARTMYR